MRSWLDHRTGRIGDCCTWRIGKTDRQIRPCLHITTLRSRERQLEFLAKTRRDAQLDTRYGADVRSATNGYVVDIELEPIAAAVSTASTALEIEAYAHLGSYVTYNEVIARAL